MVDPDINIIIYVFSLAFQISGAVLLLLKYQEKTRQRVIGEYYPGAGVANNDGDDNAVLEVERVRECVEDIYSNRMAFVFIVVGYALSIFGEKNNIDNIGNIVICLFVMVASSVIIVIEKRVSEIIAKHFYREEIKIPYKDLPNYVDTTASEKDIQRLIDRLERNR